MKMKSVARTANCAWSPEEVHSGIFLAAGTTAQQVDASFNTSSQLEVFSLDVASPDKELKAVAQTSCELRFHRIVWGALGIEQGTAPSGVLCGGTDNGSVHVFNVQRLLDNEPALMAAYRNHSGPVHALDLNPFQHNLLASGSRESEVFIWDLGNPTPQPYSPGTPSQPPEDIVNLSWNRQVQHILASTSMSRCVVWDLRKSEPIIRLAESSSRFRCKAVAWNPQVATQLCLASEDDHSPWLQIWDLRYASSPVKTLEKHRKGILSLNWNPKDPDMLVSCGKDSSVCIWNPNGAQGSELISEIHTSSEWNFEVQWCPRNPALISTASFSGELAVYSVIGGELGSGMDGGLLKKAPSWLSGGVGAQFGFGGKLVTFSKKSGSKVDVAQVVTDDAFQARVREMDEALFRGVPFDDSQQPATDSQDGGQATFWQKRLAGEDKRLWQFIQALSGAVPNVRKLQDLLGFPEQDQSDHVDNLASAFDQTVSVNGGTSTGIGDTSSATKISQTLVTGDVRQAAELCLRSRRFTEALFLADYAQDAALKESVRKEFLNVNRTDSMCRLIACVSSGLWEELAELAPVDEWQTTIAAVLGHVATDQRRTAALCATVADALVRSDRREEAMLAYLLARDLAKLAECYVAIRGEPESNEALQSLIEVLTAAKIATGAQQLPKEVSPRVGEYVHLLAEQGCLSTTLHYLNDLDTQNAKLAQLRDRILQSQGMTNSTHNANDTGSAQRQQQQQQQKPQLSTSSPQHQNQFSMHSNRNRHRTLSTTSSSFEAAAQHHSMYQQQQQQQPSVGPSGLVYSNSQHYHQQQAPLPPPPPPQQTGFNYADINSNILTPASLSAATDMSTPPTTDRTSMAARPLSRAGSKYPAVVDPSIKNSVSSYGSYGASYGPPPPPAVGAPIGRLPQDMAGYGGTTYGQPAAAISNHHHQYGPAAYGLNSRSATPALRYDGGSYSTTGPSAGTVPPTGTPADLPVGNDYTRDERYSAPGWNDPPLLRRPSRQLHSPPSAALLDGGNAGQPTTPATHLPPPPGVLNPALAPTVKAESFYGGLQQPPQQQQQQQFLQPQNQCSDGGPQDVPPQQQPFTPLPAGVQQPQPPPPPPVEKVPIPAEHQPLFDTFDRLRMACSNVQNNLVQKKMEEVTRKLENLADRFRHCELSEATTSNLQMMADAISRQDYGYAMQVFAHLAQTSNLSETSTFLPGIKTMLIIAQQHQVYV